MIGLVIAAHGRLADELVQTARSILGELDLVATLSVGGDCSSEAQKSQLRTAVLEVDEGQGVLVLADMLGGSPCSQSLSLSRDYPVEVLTGVNLPMVIKADALRRQGGDLHSLAQSLADHCHRQITRPLATGTVG